MKTRCVMYAVCLSALAAVMVPQAIGSPIICPVQDGEKIAVTAGAYRYDGGGSFLVENQDRVVDAFLTFCLETNEYISITPPNNVYTVYLADGAVKGGKGGQDPVGGDYDPLDTKTAYLYSRFFSDKSGLGTEVSLNEEDLTKAMQEVIWNLEDETTGTLSSDAQALKNLADANANGSLYGVKVMNLATVSDVGGIVHSQSLLTVCIPEPSTMAIWGLLGVCGMMVVRRRRK